jgi:superfamily I DNA/RNA helicase/mRNA-degrading endonuclease YafQ of YafQ-DinJ toxin-antitoxin module
MKVKLSKEFMTRFKTLKTSGTRKQYEQAAAILMDLETDSEVSKQFHPDGSIPNCRKYELAGGYRIVFQKVKDSEDQILALFVGSHDETERFLSNHKGWLIDPKTNGLKRLDLASYEDELINVVPSPEIQTVRIQEEENKKPVFEDIGRELLIKAGISEENAEKAMSFIEPDSLDLVNFLESLETEIGYKLLGYVCGSKIAQQEIVEFLKGNRTFLEQVDAKCLDATLVNSEQFIDLNDISENQIAFDSLPLDDWMLFLHPMQKEFVLRDFTGPARLRGVSGSGKTVVAIHRARHSARKIIEAGLNQYVLFLTYNRSLAELVELLVRQLCSLNEASRIHVLTIDKWCKDFLTFRGFLIPSWNNQMQTDLWRDCVLKNRESLKQNRLLNVINLDDDAFKYDKDLLFLDEEIKFLMGKFVHLECEKYLDCDRTGRVKGLTKEQRKTILDLYNCYIFCLTENKQFLPQELNRIALSCLSRFDQPSQYSYADIIVDEAQDLSEIQLLIVKQLALLCKSGLLLVGDGAQKIYTRGYSMKNLGINVIGRSFVLKNNYRNTREIMHAASLLRKAEGIGRYDEDPEIAQTAAVYSPFLGQKPVVIITENPALEWKTVKNEIKYLMKEIKLMPYEICCMARADWERKGLHRTLNDAGIKAVEYKAEGIGDHESVKISTLHNSKGHEFKAVFITGFFDGSIPSQSVSFEAEELEKEAAILYVAITRAKQLLYFLCPKVDETGKEQKISRFLSDIMPAVEVMDWT